MQFKYAIQTKLENTKSIKFDFIIVAAGYESRGTYLINEINIEDTNCSVFAFRDRIDSLYRKKNDEKFKKLGCNQLLTSGNNVNEVINNLNTVFEKVTLDHINIFVDYSCMTRVWYATIINYFVNKDLKIKSADIWFAYCPAKYTEPRNPMPNEYMAPISGVFSMGSSNKPTALIIGLGYEKLRAKALKEYLDSDLTYVFYSDPTYDKRFVNDIEKNNSDLLNTLDKDRIFKYPLKDLKATETILTSLCLELKKSYRVILAPLGPKPFTLTCLLLSAKYQDIDVWRVSAGESDNVYDRTPAGDPIICKATFGE